MGSVNPLLPSHWPRLRSEDRGDLAAHEPAMVQAVRTAPRPVPRPSTDPPRPALGPNPLLEAASRPSSPEPRRQRRRTVRGIDEHATDASMLPRAATWPTLLPAWQCPNRCQQPDTGEVERGDRQPTRVRFAVRESELTTTSRGAPHRSTERLESDAETQLPLPGWSPTGPPVADRPAADRSAQHAPTSIAHQVNSGVVAARAGP